MCRQTSPVVPPLRDRPIIGRPGRTSKTVLVDNRRMGSARRVGEALLVVAVQAAVLVPLAVYRFVDGDEGAYAYASRLAVHGYLPYRDFFYEQAPLLPY